MNPLELYEKYQNDPICKLLTFAICDVEYMRRSLKVLNANGSDFNEIEDFLDRINNVVMANFILIGNLDLHLSNLKIEKFKERDKAIGNLDLNVQVSEELREEMAKIFHEIQELRERINRIDELKWILCKGLNNTMNLYNQTVGDFYGRSLVRSC